jgi:hypothetical protein
MASRIGLCLFRHALARAGQGLGVSGALPEQTEVSYGIVLVIA